MLERTIWYTPPIIVWSSGLRPTLIYLPSVARRTVLPGRDCVRRQRRPILCRHRTVKMGRTTLRLTAAAGEVTRDMRGQGDALRRFSASIPPAQQGKGDAVQNTDRQRGTALGR